MQNINHNPIDLDKTLAMIASGNLLANEKAKSEIINRLRKLGTYFKYQPNNYQLESYADRLIKYRVTDYALNKAISFVINNNNSFPSFSEFYEVVKGNLKPQVQNYKDSIDYKIKVLEDQIVKQLEDNFIKAYGESRFNDFLKWYIKRIMRLDMSDGFITDYSIFKKCALFDWHDCYYQLKENVFLKVYEEKSKMNKMCYLKNKTNIPDEYVKLMEVKRKL